MTEAAFAAQPEPQPQHDLRVSFQESRLLPLRDIQTDIRSSAQLVALGVWLGHSFLDEYDDRDDLLSAESIELLRVGRIRYGSPLEIDFQLVSWAVSWAISATPTILAIAKGLGDLRLNFANASESNARRDRTQEQTLNEQLDRIEKVVDNLRRTLDEDDVRMAEHLLNQARLKPDLLQDSIDELFELSKKTVAVRTVPSRIGGHDDLPYADS